jgi:hypothetical protein
MNLQEELGKALTPQQVAELFGIDARTVRKYSERLGGVEVAPGCLRFFEKRIREIVYADANDSTRRCSMAGSGEDRREDSGLEVVRPGKRGRKKGNLLGRAEKDRAQESTEDPHKLLESVGMGKQVPK